MVKNSRFAQKFLAWHLKPSDSPNLDFLDGLRGLAVLMVVCAHLIYTNPDSSSFWVHYIGAVFLAGVMGPSLFFALSGFLVSLPFWRRKKAGEAAIIPPGYARRRFLKIYPPLALMVLVFTPIYIWLNDDPSYLKPAAEWLTGLTVFFPVDGRFNPVLWTLPVEIQFYLVLPLAMGACRHFSLAKSVLIIFLPIYILPKITYWFFSHHGIQNTLFPILYSPPFFGLDLFSFGILVSGLYTMGKVTKPWAWLGLGGLIALPLIIAFEAYLATTGGSRFYATLAGQLSLLSFGCMLCLVGDSQSLGARLISNSLLRWFGIVSYEWYLCHQAIFIWIRHAMGPANGNPATYLLIVGGSFLLSLILAALTYRYFSLPILKYSRQARAMKPRS